MYILIGYTLVKRTDVRIGSDFSNICWHNTRVGSHTPGGSGILNKGVGLT